MVTDDVGANWWFSRIVVENIFPLGLGVYALDGIGCIESVDLVFFYS